MALLRPKPPAQHARKENDGPEPPSPTVPESSAVDASDREAPVVRREGRRLGELLLARDEIAHDDLAKALDEQPKRGKRLGAVLVELNVIDEDDLASVLAEQAGVPVADLRHTTADPELLQLFPESVLRSLQAFPLRRSPTGEIVVAVADPINDDVAARLAETAKHPITIEVGPVSQIRRTIENSYSALTNVDRFVKAFEASGITRRLNRGDQAEELAGAEAPVVQVVNMIITQALRDRSSDIHIEPQDTKVRVRFRIDGALHEVVNLPATMAAAIISRIKIMAGMNIVERRRSQDGQMTMDIDDRRIDIRVATTATIWGEKCVMRLLDKRRSHYRMNELGMPADTAATFERLVQAPFGMVLCAGPTGSGKTTTLYATLSEIDDPSRNIMTIEDPVEYVFPSINQIQTNERAGLSFANGLKSILRQDPDVILVGEIRDVETARIAIQSALTGHFVLSSLHATDAAAAVHRFLDMGIESFLIASSVIAVVGQRLVRRICDGCKERYEPTTEELAFYHESGGDEKDQFFHGAGCNLCAHTGYLERIGVYELMRITPELKRLIVGWATQDELRRMAISQGMRTLQDEALTLVQNDVTTLSEVIRSIYAF